MPAPVRHFPGWDRPLLPLVLDFLTANWDCGRLDLSDAMLIVPTRQTGRLVREGLAGKAAGSGTGVLPPRVLTPEAFLRECVSKPDRVASPAESLAAWVRVLVDSRLAEFEAVFPSPPETRSIPWALGVAARLEQTRQTLGESGETFASIAPRMTEERERWEQLATLEREHHRTLDAGRMSDPQQAKIEAARLPALEWAGSRIIIAGVPDPVPLAWTALQNVAAAGRFTIEILVHAPLELADAFDEWGRVRVEKWAARHIDIPHFESRVHAVAGPFEQAECVAGLVREAIAGRHDVAIGVADAELIPHLQGELRRQAGIEGYDPHGLPCTLHPLGELLRVLESILRTRSFDSVGRLLRLPTALWGFGGSPRALEAADRLRADALPGDIESAVERLRFRDRNPPQDWLLGAFESIQSSLATFDSAPFHEALPAFLAAVHARRKFDPRKPDDAALQDVAQLTSTLAREMDVSCEQFDLNAGPAEKLSLLIRLLESETFDTERREDSIDLNGWLELPWEPARRLIVAGFNEGHVPESICGDAFLPDGARRRLGLRDNECRLARDVFLFSALLACRQSGGASVDVVLGRLAADEEALRPSRLLFRCDDCELARRASSLFGVPPESRTRHITAWQRAWKLRLPPIPPPAKIFSRIPVTAFRDYLACPFRFYLGRVLEMEAVEAARDELDPRGFGTLVHRAWEAFASNEEMKRCADERELANFLERSLRAVAADSFGRRLSLPVRVQLESAVNRVRVAARVQADTAREGWIIEHVEWPLGPDHKTPWSLGGVPISGRVDRVERNIRTSEWRVLDYKTASNAVIPEKAHRTGTNSSKKCEGKPAWMIHSDHKGTLRRWKDLQLPLYVLALREKLGTPAITTGYFQLPKSAGDIRIETWTLRESELESAARCAQAIHEAIAAHRFWPPAELKPSDPDPFKALFFGPIAENYDLDGCPFPIK